MTENLAPFWQVIEPTLPRALFGSEERIRLATVCNSLPPRHGLLFECRLKSGDMQVDVSQKISPGSSRIRKSASNFPAVATALSHWSKLNEKDRHIVNKLGLEIDLPKQANQTGQETSLFFGFQGLGQPVYRSEWFHAAKEFLRGAASASTMENVERVLNHIEAHSRDGWALGLCGIMLARSPAPVRINLTAPSWNPLSEFFNLFIDSGVASDLEMVFRICERHFDKPIVCLDISSTVSSRVGLEMFPQKSLADQSVARFLEWAVEHGLCSREKHQALEYYPLQISPDSAAIDWPDPLILKSLIGRENQFTLIRAYISHFKLTCQPGKQTEVKAYISYKHSMHEMET